MTAYVVVEMDVTDPDGYEEYKRLAGPAVAAYGGRYLARGGAAELLEGDGEPARMVVLAFDDAATARRWYDSPEYQAARRARQGCAVGRFVLVEGVPPA